MTSARRQARRGPGSGETPAGTSAEGAAPRSRPRRWAAAVATLVTLPKEFHQAAEVLPSIFIFLPRRPVADIIRYWHRAGQKLIELGAGGEIKQPAQFDPAEMPLPEFVERQRFDHAAFDLAAGA